MGSESTSEVMLVNFVSVSRVRESRTHGLIRGGCRKAVAYFLGIKRKKTAEAVS